ncbi:hemagglutinin repeat-containing protein [Fusobacterium animalis]|uniref:hemagglutinin repeat-containing protein n=1 Tax=Fusobacterium animalis TaxID=76859 RepID=UPI00130E0DDA|nr:hemagglutinin repeat-containing protein [Fusobacterium animalis]
MNGRLKKLVAIFMLFLHIISLADGIVPDNAASRNLQVDKAANGVPLVNIEAPDNNGTSHNVYKDYNVDGRGAILNNAKDLTNTQLGGMILGNPNLQNSNEASTIINEVSGVNRSRIEGYQEIAGKRANYILANPNGIYINGAGFINTGNVTFSTGRGNNLLNPEKGMIEVVGKGLDLRNINKAELIARVAELSAPIYGGDEVNLKLGSKNNKPEYALDARALGSIYAGRINIIINEDGVGVKTQAPMYATKGDVVISSRGKVYLKDTQAKGDIKISSAETEIGNKLLAENSVNIQNSKLSNKGQIQANNNITINGNVDSSNLISTNKDITISGNLKNSGNVSSTNLNAKEIENLNKIVTGEKLSSTKITNSGNFSAKDIVTTDISNSGKLLSKNINTNSLNNLGEVSSENLTTTNLENSNKINVKENINSNSVVNKTSNSEIISKNLNSNNLDNKGSITVINNVNSGVITNNGKLLVGNIINSQNLTNTVTVQGKTLDIKNKINSSGKILSDNILTKDISNSGDISSKIITAQELINSGEIISNNLSSSNINNLKNIFVNENLKANSLINSNKIESNNIEVNSLNNGGDIKVSENLTTKDITNSKNIQVGKNISTDDIKNSNFIQARNITIGKSLDNNGKLKSVDTNINTSNIKNNGEILSSNNINITTANDVNLSGKYIANNTLKIDAKSLINSINLENSGKIKLDLKENLINNKKINSSNDLNITAKKVVNIGEIGSMAKLDIDTDRLENNGALLFGNNDENKLTIKENTQNTGIINSLGKLEINTQDFENKGQIASIKDLKINSKNFTNNEDSLIFSNENVKFDLKNDFLNKGEIYSGKNIDIKALGAVTNNTATISAQNNIDINAKKITNIGKVEKKNPTIERKSALDSDTNITEKQREEAKKYFQELVNRKNNEKGIENPGRYTEGSYLFKDFKAEWIEKVKSNDVSKLSYITADNNISLTSKEDILNEEGNILANNDITITAPKVINRNSTRDVDIKIGWKAPIYEVTYTEGHDYGGEHEGHNGSGGGGHYSTSPVGTEEYIGKTTQTIGADKASKIAAGKNLTINAQKVGNGFKDNETNDIKNKSTVINKVNLTENNVNIDNVNLNRKKIEDKKVIDTKDYIFIPKGDKGLFKINKNESNKPGFSYLIETNIKYIDKSMFLGSDYFFKRIGFNPDRDIRLLGDSMYETRLINRAILEGTGRRYLGDYKSEKEQMQALYDNAVSEKEDLKLSMGIALSKDQIAKLKKDIIWYVEEEIEGQKVLVPKVYLTKNTLSKLKDNVTSLEAGEDFNISANEITNTGAINAKNLNIKTDSLVNKSSSENLATINADNIDIEAKEALSNIGATIKADKDLKVTANKVENISTHHINTNIVEIKKDNFENVASIEAGNNIDIKAKDVTNTAANIKANNDITIKSDNVKVNTLTLKDSENRKNYENTIINNVGSEITGKNISIEVNNDIGVVGSDIKAKEKLTLNAKNVDISSAESSLYERSSNRNGYTINEIKRNTESNIEAQNINMEAKKDIDIKGSNIVAKEEANIKAAGDVNIVSATDSDYSEHKESHKKSFGRSSSEEKINYSTHNVASNIIGDKVNITSGKDVNIFGSNVGAKDTGNILAKGTITEAATKDVNYSYHKKTKTGFMGLTGKSSAEKIRQELNAESNLYVKNQGIIDGDIKVIGSNLVLGNNSIINGKLTTDSNELHNSYSYEESKKGFSGSIGGGGFSVGYGKSESGLKEKDVINAKSNLVLGDGTVLNKGADITATNLTHGKITVNNGDVKFGARKDTKDVETYSKSSGVNLSVRIKSQALDRVQQGFDSFNQMKSGDMFGGIASATNTATGIVSGLASNQGTKLSLDAVKADNTVGKDNVKLAEANNNFYANMGVNLGFNKSSSRTNSHNESAVVTTIQGKDKDSSITYNNVKNIEYVGTQAKDTKFIYNNVDNITKKAVELNNSYSSSSKSSGVSAGVNIGYGRKVLTDNASVSVSASKSNMNSNETTYQNGLFVNVDEEHNNTKNMTLSGFNQIGGKVTGNIQNLTIESKQNTSSTTGSTKGGSIGFAPNGMPTSISANYSQTNGERKYVDTPTTFIIGEGSNLKVGKVDNTASAIGTTGNGKLSIDEYVGHNLENKDNTTTKGASVSLSQSSIPISGVGVNYANRDLESVTKNTVVGNVEIGKSSGDEINKDLDTMTEVTKDEDTKTNVFVESQTIKYALNPEAFKEDLEKAKNEITDMGNVVENTVNPKGLDKRNILENLRAQRGGTTLYNVVGSRVEALDKAFKDGIINEEEYKEAVRKVIKGYGKDIGVDFEVVYLDEKTMPKDAKGSTGSAFINKETEKMLMPIDVNKIKDTGSLWGVIAEEVSHIQDGLEGRQDKKVAEDETNKEKGLESLGRPTNDYFKNEFSKDDKAIGIVSDGKDYSNVDFGENVGDYISPEDLKYRKYYREEVLPYDENYQNFLRNILSMGLDFSPLGTGKGITEGIVGYDTVTGEKLDLATRIIGAIPIANGIFKTGRRAIKFLKPAKKVETILADGSKVVLNVDDTIKTANKAQEIISSSGTTKVVAKETKVIDKTTDITKASKNVEKVTDVSENITKAVAKEAKVIDKSSDIAKNSESIIDSTKNTVDKTVNILNKNKDLYYEGRKVYTAKELNQMGRVKGGSPNRGVEYIYESPAGKANAQEFQWGTSGSMMQNTPVGKKNVVPALRYDNPNTEGMNFIKFDGIEVENGVTCLIDAKRNVPYWNKGGMETVKGTLRRISEAKKQNPGIRVIYEFPNETAAGYFRDWLKTNRNFNNIVEIRVRK